MKVSGFCGGAIADVLLCEYIAIAIPSQAGKGLEEVLGGSLVEQCPTRAGGAGASVLRSASSQKGGTERIALWGQRQTGCCWKERECLCREAGLSIQ